jgi:SAM-dependent methyltransferase
MMSPMTRIAGPMHRYGEADFDREYLRWGFHDPGTQAKEADSVVGIAGKQGRLRILDLACGRGVHAAHWAKQGHTVTGVDISETFIAQARELASREAVSVGFVVSDLQYFRCTGKYDVVTWIENSFFNEAAVAHAYQCVADGGCFVLDVRNPEHPKAKFRQGNWRTWREETGVFYLERHETDEQTGVREDVWLTIDPQRDLIEEKINTAPHPISLSQKIQVLREAGFGPVELRTMEGGLFTGGPEPYWLWLVGRT